MSNAIGICKFSIKYNSNKRKHKKCTKKVQWTFFLFFQTLLASKNNGHCINFRLGSDEYGTTNKSISLHNKKYIRYISMIISIGKNDLRASLITYKIFFPETADYFIPQLSKLGSFSSLVGGNLYINFFIML